MALSDRIADWISHDLGSIDREVTVRYLLTHTSGIGDYIDEEESGDYFDILKLYETRPVHKWNTLDYYLPMFNELPAKFTPGERFGYSNAGFILLGLVIEGASGMEYHRFVEERIIRPLGLCHTGFYRMNNLPGNTALGYVYNKARGEDEANILYMPVVGGSDGGLFTCASDMARVWKAVMECRLFSESMRESFLAEHAEEMGLGVFRRDENRRKAYYTVGGDFGIDFFSAFFPRQGVSATALGNTEMNTFPLFRELFEVLG